MQFNFGFKEIVCIFVPEIKTTTSIMAKEYTVISHHNGRKTEFTGTIEHLINDVFGYTLECGHSWNNKIPEKPKSIKTLIKALNDSALECRHYSDWYELKAA